MNSLFSETFGEGPDLVLLHGWGIHSGIWQFVRSQLRNDYRVTVIDLPGFGRSASVIATDLNSILLHIIAVAPEKAIWVGWSLGGLIATQFANQFPDRVIKLVCVASSPKFLQATDWPGMNVKVLANFAQQLHTDYVGTLTRFLLLQFFGTNVDKNMMKWLQENLFLYGQPTMPTLLTGLTLLEQLDCREVVKKLHCKVLYLLGRLDTLVPAQLATVLDEFPSHIQTIVLPKASHALFLSHEQQFINHIRQFAHE